MPHVAVIYNIGRSVVYMTGLIHFWQSSIYSRHVRGISDRPHVPFMHVFSELIIGPRKAYVVDIVVYLFYISESPIT